MGSFVGSVALDWVKSRCSVYGMIIFICTLRIGWTLQWKGLNLYRMEPLVLNVFLQVGWVAR